jgi:hypothetical protein
MANPSTPKALALEAALGSVVSPGYALTQRFAGGKTTESKVVEGIGENTLVTPAAGKQITLYWIALETSEGNAAEVLAEVKLGALTPYTWYLGKPGAFMHWEPIVGAGNAALVLKLSAAQKVAASFTYTEG